MSTIEKPRSSTDQTQDCALDDPREAQLNGGSGSGGPPAVDPRIKALWRFGTSITIFTVVGAFLLHFENSWLQPVVALATSYTLELGLETLNAWSCGKTPRYRGGWKPLAHFLLPAHITALSISLMLYPGTNLEFIVFAVAVAACSKFIFTVKCNGKKRHFMNPSNLGVAVTLLAFPWIVSAAPPYQYTENVAHTALAALIPLGIIGAGTMINAKLTKKTPLILGWLAGFVLQAGIRSVFFDGIFLSALFPMTGLVFWVYTNYMITDPGTTPVKPRNQAVFGFSVAIVYGILVINHVVFGLFFALSIVCLLRGLVLAAPAWRDALRRVTARPSPVAVAEPARDGVAT
jgi:hypothetical protein